MLGDARQAALERVIVILWLFEMRTMERCIQIIDPIDSHYEMVGEWINNVGARIREIEGCFQRGCSFDFLSL